MYAIDNTFGLKVYAQEMIALHSVDEAQTLLPKLKGKKYFIVGGGSNLLFTSEVYDGVIVHLDGPDNIDNIENIDILEGPNNEVTVRAPGYIVWDDFVAWCCNKGYWGAENLSYIPGEVGASAVQNIGAYGVEVKDIISRIFAVEVETGALREFTNAECKYGYRESIFKTELWQQYLVYAVEFRLSRVATPRLEYKPLNTMFNAEAQKCVSLHEIRQAIISIRKEKLPEVGVIGSAGSFFKNPIVSIEEYKRLKSLYPTIPHFDAPNGVKIPAAWLIDNAGLKGHKHGKAMVFEKQPLVLVNPGGATAQDVVGLAQHVIDIVFDKYGVRLFPEVNYVN